MALRKVVIGGGRGRTGKKMHRREAGEAVEVRLLCAAGGAERGAGGVAWGWGLKGGTMWYVDGPRGGEKRGRELGVGEVTLGRNGQESSAPSVAGGL